MVNPGVNRSSFPASRALCSAQAPPDGTLQLVLGRGEEDALAATNDAEGSAMTTHAPTCEALSIKGFNCAALRAARSCPVKRRVPGGFSPVRPEGVSRNNAVDSLLRVTSPDATSPSSKDSKGDGKEDSFCGCGGETNP